MIYLNRRIFFFQLLLVPYTFMSYSHAEITDIQRHHAISVANQLAEEKTVNDTKERIVKLLPSINPSMSKAQAMTLVESEAKNIKPRQRSDVAESLYISPTYVYEPRSNFSLGPTIKWKIHTPDEMASYYKFQKRQIELLPENVLSSASGIGSDVLGTASKIFEISPHVMIAHGFSNVILSRLSKSANDSANKTLRQSVGTFLANQSEEIQMRLQNQDPLLQQALYSQYLREVSTAFKDTDPEIKSVIQDKLQDMFFAKEQAEFRSLVELGREQKKIGNNVVKIASKTEKLISSYSALQTQMQKFSEETVSSLNKLSTSISKMQSSVSEIDTRLSGIEKVLWKNMSSQEKLDALQRFSWNTELKGQERIAEIARLESAAKVEEQIERIESVAIKVNYAVDGAKTLSSLLQAAGIDNSELVKNINSFQEIGSTVALVAVAYTTLDPTTVMSAVQSVAGLLRSSSVGESEATRQFKKINEKLDYVIRLQEATVKALENLQGITQLGFVDVRQDLDLISNQQTRALQAHHAQLLSSCPNLQETSERGFERARDLRGKGAYLTWQEITNVYASAGGRDNFESCLNGLANMLSPSAFTLRRNIFQGYYNLSEQIDPVAQAYVSNNILMRRITSKSDADTSQIMSLAINKFDSTDDARKKWISAKARNLPKRCAFLLSSESQDSRCTTPGFEAGTMDDFFGMARARTATDISNNRAFDPSVVRWAANFALGLGWWSDVLNADFHLSQTGTRPSFTDKSRARTQQLYQNLLYNLTQVQAQYSIKNGELIVPFLFDRYTANISNSDERSLELHEIETAIAINPVLAINFLTYFLRETIRENWLSNPISVCHKDVDLCAPSSYGASYAVALKTSYSTDGYLGPCISPKQLLDVQSVDPECFPDSHLKSPMARLGNFKGLAVVYRSQNSQKSTVTYKLKTECVLDRLKPEIGKTGDNSDMRFILNEHCQTIFPKIQNENRSGKSVEVSVPIGWSVIFAGVAVPFPPESFVGTGKFVNSSDSALINRLITETSTKLIDSKLFKDLDETGIRNVVSAIIASP